MSERVPPPAGPDWLRGVLAGDASAIDVCCREQHAAVYRLCLGFLASASDAEDTAQDAMLRLLDGMRQYDPQQPFAQWRNTVVLNLCRDRQRSWRRRRRAHLDAVAARADAMPAPSDALERRELRAMLEQALRALPVREREAFVLRDLEDVDTADVATAMGVTPATVRSLLTLARRRLRGLLADRLEAQPPTAAPCIDGEDRRG
ncbi:MAG: sigma-70 family RNA polymerase sigma factor [Planctomycetes bacterium]|nr:sigma-70 family RNA polymerase sigma factor [Planctomycetota bacterium]